MKRKGKGKGNGQGKISGVGVSKLYVKSVTVLTAFYQCTPADNARGSFGMKYTDFFLPDDKVGTLTPDCVGKEFIPQYGINGFGKPTLEDFSFKEWKA